MRLSVAGAIRSVTNDVDLRAELSRRGRAQAEALSIARYQERVKQLYEAVG